MFSEKHPAFSEGSIRFHIFNATSGPSSRGIRAGNKFARAFVRVGRRVLIDEEAFFECINEQDPRGMDPIEQGEKKKG